MELEFGHVGFWGEMKTAGIPREKERTRQTTTNSTNKVRRTRDSNPCTTVEVGSSHQIERTSLQSHCHVTIFFLSQQTAFLQIWQIKTTKKKWHAGLSCALLHSGTKRWPIPFFHRSTMQTDISVKTIVEIKQFASLLTWLHTFPLCWWRLDFYFSPTG